MKRIKLYLLIILLVASFLRLWKIGEVPVSLFGDELDVGYHSYSILKTGKDYSGNSWPLHFQSLAEWRTPLYLYSTVPTVAMFGISPLGVRLPAAIFGILGILAFYFLLLEIGNWKLAVTASLILAVSPWHIQYSRAGFEVTLLLLLLLLGLYLFFKALKYGKWLWLSTTCLAFTPWVYSTAKLFTPILLIFLFVVWRKEILKVSKKYLVFSLLSLVIIGAPITYSTLYGGGAQRFGYISVFTDPTREPEIGVARQHDARMRGETGAGLTPKLADKVIHNKFTFWGQNILNNYFQAFSADFLFIKGDPNLRHSVDKVGQFYKIEALALFLGLIFFFTRSTRFARSGQANKIKWLIAFWILVGVIPSAITRDGGNHATRLILILPPLIFLIAYGLVETSSLLTKLLKPLFFILYSLFFILNFISYQHEYWIHNPWDSERWWHTGFKESIQSIKAIDKNYEKVIISTANEPPWIFFAGWYEYPPEKWHKEFPIGNDVEVSGFGKISHTGKFYFGSPQKEIGVYDLSKYIDDRTLYLAVAKEVGANLIMEPARTPAGLKLIKAISYPSGEPAFYLFTKD